MPPDCVCYIFVATRAYGAVNLPAGHGLVNGKFDAFWTGGKRYGLDGTINGNALTLDGGAGDNFRPRQRYNRRMSPDGPRSPLQR